MDNYEIRITKKDHSIPVIYVAPQANDYAAVRRANSLVHDGDSVEVWRGNDCVYSRRQRPDALPSAAIKLS